MKNKQVTIKDIKQLLKERETLLKEHEKLIQERQELLKKIEIEKKKRGNKIGEKK